ncbi:hypothetical protein CJ030_MR1G028493 [Morella rubra]|uniref:Uncharacterized protein n=1 Tax=Morella rubra TaxID=262757 RepID=A0A6A1WMQ4_9ROSI|nr:hypothetical protein CJ030_MR1G028493 [Morella rubra]
MGKKGRIGAIAWVQRKITVEERVEQSISAINRRLPQHVQRSPVGSTSLQRFLWEFTIYCGDEPHQENEQRNKGQPLRLWRPKECGRSFWKVVDCIWKEWDTLQNSWEVFQLFTNFSLSPYVKNTNIEYSCSQKSSLWEYPLFSLLVRKFDLFISERESDFFPLVEGYESGRLLIEDLSIPNWFLLRLYHQSLKDLEGFSRLIAAEGFQKSKG